jgi:hypothetical protein
MMQVIQNIRTGQTAVKDVPTPICLPGHVLVAAHNSFLAAKIGWIGGFDDTKVGGRCFSDD